jgi:ribosomal protein S18 acetylase RimI-like enzyme
LAVAKPLAKARALAALTRHLPFLIKVTVLYYKIFILMVSAGCPYILSDSVEIALAPEMEVFFLLDIRYIEPPEAELVSRIVREANAEQATVLKIDPLTFPNFVGFETAEAVLKRMEQGDRVALAFLDGEPIGTISCRALIEDPSHGHVKRFAILPRFRGRDFGRGMMVFAEEGLWQSGVTTAEVSLVAAFTRLRDYYVRLGYIPGETRSFATVPFEVLFMEKDISDRL